MKALTVVLSFLTIFSTFTNLFSKPTQPVNQIIKDKSFVSKFGFLPTAETDEVLRIKTHLEYVEQFLRNKKTEGISATLIENRNNLLNILHQYIVEENFPSNYDYEGQRLPCFIDKNGKICAVGYLIEKSAGRGVAEDINLRHKYDLIMEMNDESVNEWIERSGLTKAECAMIQPGYEYGYDNNPISTSYIIFSSAFIASSLTFSMLNAVNISKETKSIDIPIVGLTVGTAQIIYGAYNYPNKRNNSESEKVLSAVNIGIGASSVILSTIALLSKQKPEQKKVSWNLYPFRIKESAGVGIQFIVLN
ncbi:MAG: hypothetical protein WAT71_09450 [Ignavibacteria bacterium]